VTIPPSLPAALARPTDGGASDALALVLARAETDDAFRARLLAEPHGAIYDAFGIQVPADFRLRFIERHADVDALVVLPDLRRADGELSVEELEQVAGGTQAQNAHLAWKGAKRPRHD
jgi:hypothetical protein